MANDAINADERMRLAERWRLVGESLRKRSPASFAKFVEMLMAFGIDEDEDGDEKIDGIYRIH